MFNISVQNFEPGVHEVKCMTNRGGNTRPFHEKRYFIRVPSSGSVRQDVGCVHGIFPNDSYQVWAHINGLDSNRLEPW